MLFTLFGYWVWGGHVSPKGLVHNLLLHFFPWAAEKTKFPKLSIFDIVTTNNDHPSHIKHVLGSTYMFFLRVFSVCVTSVCIAQGRFFTRWTCRRIFPKPFCRRLAKGRSWPV